MKRYSNLTQRLPSSDKMEVWLQYLEDLKKLPENTIGRESAIEAAEEMIAYKRLTYKPH